MTSTNKREDVELMRIVKQRVFHIHGAMWTYGLSSVQILHMEK
jgi:hypothetical protein